MSSKRARSSGLVLLLGTLWLMSLTFALENGLSRTPHRGWSRSVFLVHMPQFSYSVLTLASRHLHAVAADRIVHLPGSYIVRVSWNKFKCRVDNTSTGLNENTIISMAQAMVSSGLSKHGSAASVLRTRVLQTARN